MSRKLRKFVSAVALCVSFALIAPSAHPAFAATTKTFTYAEQTTNEKVTELVMSKGEKVDIKFMDIKEASSADFFKKYARAWVSSNTKVAIVSSTGVITAVGKGEATIEYKVTGGDGKINYVSTGVKVYVDSYKQEVKIGISDKEEVKYHVMEMGTTATLKANGLKENVANRYEFNWSSTDTSVATVDKNGVVTPVKPGYSVIQLKVKKLSNGEEYVATPIALHVKEKAVVPTPTPTETPEEEKYSLLKRKADEIAFSCAETVVSKMLKNPSSMEVFDEEIIDSDAYFRYYITIEYSATNSYGGEVTDKAYVLIRVNPKMDGTFYYTYNKTLGIDYIVLDSEKEEWGWGTEPSDWSLDAAEQYINPVEVSVKMILAYPEKYEGQYVKIKEKLVISSNYLSNRYFRTLQSTGSGKYSYNTNAYINVFYRLCNNVDECIMLEADYQKITVYGYVKTYSNSTEPYIETYEIVFE